MKKFLYNYGWDMIPITVLVAMTISVMVSFQGCGSDSTTVVNYEPPVSSSSSSSSVSPLPLPDTPTNYVGTGNSYSPFMPYANGEVPLYEGWTYYSFVFVTGAMCTYQVLLPNIVTNAYLVDGNLTSYPYTFTENRMIFQADAQLSMDLYSLENGDVEVFSDCY